MNREEIKRTVLSKMSVINALTLKERNAVIEKGMRPRIDDAVEKYAALSSKSGLDKVVEKCDIEKLSDDDFYMAFYNKENEEINNKLCNYIENQEWFGYFIDALADFDVVSDSNVRYNINYAIYFLLRYSQKVITKKLKSLSNISCGGNIMEKMLHQAAINSLQVYSKTLIYDYHLNKSNYDNRFQEYVKNNFSSVQEIINFYLKYPVLLRRVSVKMMNITNYFCEMLQNIDDSFLELSEKKMIFGNVMTDIHCDMGDTHESGKFVVKVAFNQLTFMYKPRNLYITKCYYDFVEWINSKFDLYKLPVIETIWKDTFTLEKCVTFEECETINDVKRYYERIGYYIAMLFIMNGNDMHYENLIAHKDYPVLVDLETLFSRGGEQMLFTGSSTERIIRFINHSVSGSCLLPSYMFRNQENKGVDVSGLGGKKAAIPQKTLVLSSFEEDDIKYEMKTGYINNHNNIPILDGKRMDYKEYTDCMLIGFEKFMNLVSLHKKEFAEQMDGFADIKVRQVLRATQNYAYMLQFASHPNYTSDMVYVERMLDSLWSHPYKNKQIVSCEIEEMLNDDIPVFFSETSKTDLVDGRGYVIKSFYNKDSISLVKEKICNLQKKDTMLQTLLINNSFGFTDEIITEEMTKKYDTVRFGQKNKVKQVTQDVYDNVVENICKILQKEAVYGEDDVNWLVTQEAAFGEKTISAAPYNLKNGLAGVLLSLVQNKPDEELIKKIISTLYNLQPIGSKSGKVSILTGLFSAIYPLYLYCDGHLDDKIIQLYDSSLVWYEQMIDEVDNDSMDLSGLASAIILFFHLYDQTSDLRYYTFGKKSVGALMDFGKYYILEKAQDYEIDKLNYAFIIAQKYLNDENLSVFRSEVLDAYRKKKYGANYKKELVQKPNLYSNFDYTVEACKYKALTCAIEHDDITYSELKVGVQNIKQSFSFNYADKFEKIDCLNMCKKVFENDPQLSTMIENELVEIINLTNMASSEECNAYNCVLFGVGLDSPLCGLWMRLKTYMDGTGDDDILYSLI